MLDVWKYCNDVAVKMKDDKFVEEHVKTVIFAFNSHLEVDVCVAFLRAAKTVWNNPLPPDFYNEAIERVENE